MQQRPVQRVAELELDELLDNGDDYLFDAVGDKFDRDIFVVPRLGDQNQLRKGSDLVDYLYKKKIGDQHEFDDCEEEIGDGIGDQHEFDENEEKTGD
eukprot:Skav214762  [mRNA]  locus=scaffold1230:126109:127562:+ [translate_table: standard]